MDTFTPEQKLRILKEVNRLTNKFYKELSTENDQKKAEEKLKELEDLLDN